tara:strand:+ start:250 stop:705 length:456 start_codon:yes stop_codon:yes gene_type:complete
MGMAASDNEGLLSTPFVSWPPEGPAWIEGNVRELWEGQYGKNATMVITGCSAGLGGKDSPAFEIGGRANVGLSSASLRDTIDETHIDGPVVHVGFLGWAESKEGNRYRRFTVLAVASASEPASTADPVAAKTKSAAIAAFDLADANDKLPF